MGCADGWVGHGGTLPGYNTQLYYDTTTDSTVAVMVNSDIASGKLPRVADADRPPEDRGMPGAGDP
jgi:hypothetical protein